VIITSVSEFLIQAVRVFPIKWNSSSLSAITM